MPVVRTMFISEELNEVVHPPWENMREGLKLSQLRAYLDIFTMGRLISVAEDPYNKPTSTYLARVDPTSDEVWDIRVIDPRPGIRALGAFAGTDIFVALTWNDRPNLGGRGSPEWAAEIDRCKAKWRQLFPTYRPHKGASLHDYLSGNFHAV